MDFPKEYWVGLKNFYDGIHSAFSRFELCSTDFPKLVEIFLLYLERGVVVVSLFEKFFMTKFLAFVHDSNFATLSLHLTPFQRYYNTLFYLGGKWGLVA